MSDALPQWLEDYAQECRVLFGLEVWEIVVNVVDAPDGDKDNDGFSWVNVRYLSAKIELRRDQTDVQFRSVMMHEMLHVALAPISQAHMRLFELLPKKLRRHVKDICNDGLEQTIERLTRALQREITPSKTKDAVASCDPPTR